MSSSNESSGGVPVPGAAFATTHWSRVLAARDPDAPGSTDALNQLCQEYWRPLYAYIRRRGHGPQESEDLTQGFFEKFLAKDYLGDLTPGMGRFRSFLLTCLKHFLANQWDHDHRQKRGGGQITVSFDAARAEEDYGLEPADQVTPEIVYERQWAMTVLDTVLLRLRAELVQSGREALFNELKPFLRGENASGSYAEVSARTGLQETAVRVAVHRLRRRYGELLRAEVTRTVADEAEVQDEIRHLIDSLGR